MLMISRKEHLCFCLSLIPSSNISLQKEACTSTRLNALQHGLVGKGKSIFHCYWFKMHFWQFRLHFALLPIPFGMVSSAFHYFGFFPLPPQGPIKGCSISGLIYLGVWGELEWIGLDWFGGCWNVKTSVIDNDCPFVSDDWMKWMVLVGELRVISDLF